MKGKKQETHKGIIARKLSSTLTNAESSRKFKDKPEDSISNISILGNQDVLPESPSLLSGLVLRHP